MNEPPVPTVQSKVLDDAAVDGVTFKELREAYKALRSLYISKTDELKKLHQKISVETKRALGKLKRRGMKTGGDEPYGYQLGPDGKTLRPYLPEQRLIETIVKLRGRGTSFHGIAVRLNEHGERNRNNEPFHTKTIIRIFRAAKLREVADRTIEAKQGPSARDP